MGGFGSGRRWGCQTKGMAEHCPAVDVRRLHRDGLLSPVDPSRTTGSEMAKGQHRSV